jgi:hypothetical protein
MASTALLPAATNHQVACRLLLTGDLITAQVSALQAGGSGVGGGGRVENWKYVT